MYLIANRDILNQLINWNLPSKKEVLDRYLLLIMIMIVVFLYIQKKLIHRSCQLNTSLCHFLQTLASFKARKAAVQHHTPSVTPGYEWHCAPSLLHSVWVKQCSLNFSVHSNHTWTILNSKSWTFMRSDLEELSCSWFRDKPLRDKLLEHHGCLNPCSTLPQVWDTKQVT
jgi:hypothetical protein